MATNLEKYPIVQLLDNLNNPVSPAVQIDSIYDDPGSKNPLDIVYKYESATLSVRNLSTGVSSDGDAVIKQKGTESSQVDGGAPDISENTLKDLYIVTDTWAGNGPNDESDYKVDNTLHVRKYNASELLAWWFEHDYLNRKAGAKIFFGTCMTVPTGIETGASGKDEAGNDYSNVTRVTSSGEGFKYSIGHVIDGNDKAVYGHPIYKVIDFNSTNFFAFDNDTSDMYPRRGVINPSGEYIWFVIDSSKVNSQSVKLYGFSGEDSPQEIDITPVANMSNAWRSVGKFGIDQNFNSSDINGGDGLDYHIFVKYKEAN